MCDFLQLPEVHTNSCDNISQFSVDSITSLESKEPVFIAAGDIRSGQASIYQNALGGEAQQEERI